MFGTDLSLVGSLLRILYFHTENQKPNGQQQSGDVHTEGVRDQDKDAQLEALIEIAVELLSTILTNLPTVRLAHRHSFITTLHYAQQLFTFPPLKQPLQQ